MSTDVSLPPETLRALLGRSKSWARGVEVRLVFAPGALESRWVRHFVLDALHRQEAFRAVEDLHMGGSEVTFRTRRPLSGLWLQEDLQTLIWEGKLIDVQLSRAEGVA